MILKFKYFRRRDSHQTMKVLVTGATGFLGSTCGRGTYRAGPPCAALGAGVVRTPHWLTLPNTQCQVVDLHDHRSILPAYSGVDAVVTQPVVDASNGSKTSTTRTRTSPKNSLKRFANETGPFKTDFHLIHRCIRSIKKVGTPLRNRYSQTIVSLRTQQTGSGIYLPECRQQRPFDHFTASSHLRTTRHQNVQSLSGCSKKALAAASR